MLFNKKLLQNEINNFEFPANYDFARVNKIIGNWQKALKDGNYDKTKETQVQASFLNLFFNIILGYTEMNDNPDEWYLINEAKTEFDGTKADGALGFFTKNEKSNITRAVIELKDAKTPLDKKQSSRKDYDSPISQAFSYSSKFDHCDWIIVSNFKEIRLYHKSRGQGYYESFEILHLDNEQAFKRFYFLLCKDNLIDKNLNSLLDKLVNDTSKQEEDISKKFYQDFKAVRSDLFNHLIENNLDIDRILLLEKTQKLLDRLIFVMFCKDTRLLPNDIVKVVYELGIKSRERSDKKAWREFKNLFQDIDEGRHDIDPPINKYNGGLFALDEDLDNLIIKDNVWQKIVALSGYDFESDLNVNILGHIFEQSLSDLEQLKADIDGIKEDKKKSKRKKDGIYYTPEYITRYIVEQTIGKYLEEHPDKLESIKILDPACGSGAFLNQAHSFLRDQYKIRYEEKLATVSKDEQFKVFEHYNIAETDRSILLNNLYGVDLNEESTEITKLSLWLKTAKKTEPLQNLDNNIKCGNSLVDNSEFAGNKAFKWGEEFKDIIGQGGFDIVIGNPPYVRQELFSNIKPYLEKSYEVYTGVSDLYVYFFEKGLKLLKEGGYFAFIVSNKFLKAGYGKKLTKYLQMNYKIVEIIDFGDLQIFEGATTYPCIITIKKELPKKIQVCNFLKLENLHNITDLKQEVIKKGFELAISIMDETWASNNKQNFGILEKLRKNNISLGEYIKDLTYRGLITGFNEAFIIDTKTKEKLTLNDSKSINFIKPVLRGIDISRNYYNWQDLWIIAIPSGWTNKNKNDEDAETFFRVNYSAIYKHLLDIQEKVESGQIKAKGKGLLLRDDKGDYWWELRQCAYYNEFIKSKIIWGNLATKSSFSYDESKTFYICAPACLIPTEEKWLLPILNSKTITYFLKNTAIERQGGFVEQKPVYVKQIPIPKTDKKQRESLAKKAEQIIELNKNLHDSTKQALEFIKEKYNILKPSQKLEKFYQLGVNFFIDELKKKKVKLSLSEEEELRNWFKDKQVKLLDLEKQIQVLDKIIDNEVYELYGLTDEEIKIIETT
jgi:type II restriction/modification system DNA methylase subunit YeeA